ncbi:hypothetical protein E8E14_013997 [Neopestalotiopsis sp. 37M]|nr:hypothetical protein E8E14_013997 [Neopestalotiopsis sp. 37M]
MSPFPLQPMHSMSLLVRGLIIDSSQTLPDAITHTVDALDLMSPSQDVVAVAAKQSHLTFRQVKASLRPTTFASLPTELKVGVVAAHIDNWCAKFLEVGARLQPVGTYHKNVRLPITMQVSRMWRQESLRRLARNGINLASSPDGAVVIHRSSVYLCDRNPEQYPDHSKTILQTVNTVVTDYKNVIPDDEYECGLLVESILTGMLFNGLQTLRVVISPRYHNPVITLNAPSDDLEDIVYANLRRILSLEPFVTKQRRISLASGESRMFQRTCMEFFLPLNDKPLWRRVGALVEAFCPLLDGGRIHNNLAFFRNNAELVWDVESEPFIQEHFSVSADILYDSLRATMPRDTFPYPTRSAFDQEMDNRIPRIEGCVRFLLAPNWKPLVPFDGLDDYVSIPEYNRITQGQ